MVSDVHEPMSSGLPFISLLRRRGWIVVLTAIVAVVVALLWLLGHRSEYGATAKLRFHTKHQRHLVAAAQTAGPTPGWLALDHALQATRRHIPSGVEPAPTQQLDVVAISATKSSPELAAKSANRFAAGLVRTEKRRNPGSHAVSVVRSAAPPTSPLGSGTGKAGHRSDYVATAKLRFHTKQTRHLIAAAIAQTAAPTQGWVALNHALKATRRHVPSGVEFASTPQPDVVAVSATKSSPELAAKSANRFVAGLVRSYTRKSPRSHPVSVVRSAAPPTSPLPSDTGRALGIAGALGALLGLAFAFLVERFGPPVPANTTKVTDRIRPARVRRRRLRKRPAWRELPRQGPP